MHFLNHAVDETKFSYFVISQVLDQRWSPVLKKDCRYCNGFPGQGYHTCYGVEWSARGNWRGVEKKLPLLHNPLLISYKSIWHQYWDWQVGCQHLTASVWHTSCANKLTQDNDCCDRLLVTSASICSGVHQNGCRCLSIFRDTSRYGSRDAQFCLQIGRQASKSITPKPGKFNTLCH